MDGLLWRFPKWYDTSHNSKKCSPERQFFEATFTVHKLCHFKDLQNWDFLEHSNGQIHVIGCHWDVFHQFHAKKIFLGGHAFWLTQNSWNAPIIGLTERMLRSFDVGTKKWNSDPSHLRDVLMMNHTTTSQCLVSSQYLEYKFWHFTLNNPGQRSILNSIKDQSQIL